MESKRRGKNKRSAKSSNNDPTLVAFGSYIGKESNAAAALFQQGQYAQALEIFLRIIKLTKVAPYIQTFAQVRANMHVSIGRCYHSLDQIPQARESFTTAIQLSSGQFDDQFCDAHFYLAQSFLSTDDWAQAIPHLKKAITHRAWENQATASLFDVYEKLFKKAHENGDFVTALKYAKEMEEGAKTHSEWKNQATENLLNVYEKLFKKAHDTRDFAAALAYGKEMEEKAKDDVRVKILALYHQGMTHSKEDSPIRNPRKAIACYEKVVALYRANLATLQDDNAELKKAIAAAAYNWALLLDTPEEDLEENPARVVKLLYFSASLGESAAWYNLGFKYQHGEDVTQDVDNAIDCYQKAMELGHMRAEGQLGRIFLYHPEKQDVTRGLEYLTHAAKSKDPSALRTLSLYHTRAMTVTVQSTESKMDSRLLFPLDQAKRREENTLAHVEIKEAAALGDPQSIFQAAIFFEHGIGCDANEEQAEIYYRDAMKFGLPEAAGNLFFILQKRFHKFLDDKDSPTFQTRLQAMLPDLAQCFKMARPDEYKEEDFSSNKPLEEIVTAVLSKHTLPEEDRETVSTEGLGKYAQFILKNLGIQKIGSYNAEEMAMVIAQIGKCIECSRNNRQFLNNILFNLRVLLNQAAKMLGDGKFSQQQIQAIIIGISKFSLSAKVEEHANCLVLFYNAILKAPDLKLATQNLLLYAATRLDPALPLFKKQIPELIGQIFNQKTPWDKLPIDAENKRIFSNLLYSLMRFDVDGHAYLDNHRDEFNLFIKAVLSQCKAQLDQTEPCSENDLMYCQQMYLGLLHFKEKYPALAIDNNILKLVLKKLSQKEVETHTSASQKMGFYFLKRFYPTAEAEKVVHTLPQDGWFKIAANRFLIYDYRGPGHYLHHDNEAKDEPVLDLNSRAHERLAQIPRVSPALEKVDFIAVPYFKLSLDSSDEEMHAFFAKELSRVGITLPRLTEAGKWDGAFFSSRSRKSTLSPSSTVPKVGPTILK